MKLNISSPQIVISGNSYLEIEGCLRIMEYNDVYLKIKTCKGIVAEIWGQGLTVSDYNTSVVAVRGLITSVELHGREETK